MMQAAKTPNADMRHVARRFRFCARKNVSGLRGVKDWAGLTLGLGLGLAASGILMLGLRLASSLRAGKRHDPDATDAVASVGLELSLMKTVAEVVAMLRQELKTAIDNGLDTDRVGNIRVRQLLIMEDCLIAIGFPTNSDHKGKTSLVPYIFQEANYDGISWTDKDEDLSHLSAYFELDFMVQNEGKERKEATAEEFEQYCNQSLEFIDRKQAAG